LAVGDGGGELEHEHVVDAQVARIEGRVGDAAAEVDGLHGDGRTIDRDGELGDGGRVERAVRDEVPVGDRRRIGVLGRDALELEDGRRDDAQGVVTHLREARDRVFRDGVDRRGRGNDDRRRGRAAAAGGRATARSRRAAAGGGRAAARGGATTCRGGP